MRTSAHIIVSLLAGILILALSALGSGALEMVVYYGGSIYFLFESHSNLAQSFWKTFPFLTIFGLLLDISLAVAGSFFVFQRIHYDRCLPRRPN
jgi:hypothetical protein